MSLLYINACVRENSRTNILTKHLLSKFTDKIEEIRLNTENICGLNSDTLNKRDDLILKQEFDNPVFKYAKQFANADIIVIAAPLWDLSFPALLKTYLELINVSGITFKYSDKGIPESLCKAKKLIYITTSGGQIFNDEYGFGYIKALCNTFYGIKNIKYFKAEGLDIIGNNTEEILENTKKEIDKEMINDKDFNIPQYNI